MSSVTSDIFCHGDVILFCVVNVKCCMTHLLFPLKHLSLGFTWSRWPTDKQVLEFSFADGHEGASEFLISLAML